MFILQFNSYFLCLYQPFMMTQFSIIIYSMHIVEKAKCEVCVVTGGEGLWCGRAKAKHVRNNVSYAAS